MLELVIHSFIALFSVDKKGGKILSVDEVVLLLSEPQLDPFCYMDCFASKPLEHIFTSDCSTDLKQKSDLDIEVIKFNLESQ